MRIDSELEELLERLKVDALRLEFSGFAEGDVRDMLVGTEVVGDQEIDLLKRRVGHWRELLFALGESIPAAVSVGALNAGLGVENYRFDRSNAELKNYLWMRRGDTELLADRSCPAAVEKGEDRDLWIIRYVPQRQGCPIDLQFDFRGRFKLDIRHPGGESLPHQMRAMLGYEIKHTPISDMRVTEHRIVNAVLNTPIDNS